jgi:sensor histidine kinase regulating citrate/malate metabolism
MFRRIRDKLIATYLIVVVLAIVYLGVHLAQQFELAYTEQLKADLLELARLMAFNAEEGLAAGDADAIRRHLQGEHHGGSGPQVLVTDASGVVVGDRAVPDSVVGTRAKELGIAEALQGREVAGLSNVPGSEDAVYAAVPVLAGGRVLGAVRVAHPLTYLNAQLQHIRWVVAWGTIVALFLAGGVGLILTR